MRLVRAATAVLILTVGCGRKAEEKPFRQAQAMLDAKTACRNASERLKEYENETAYFSYCDEDWELATGPKSILIGIKRSDPLKGESAPVSGIVFDFNQQHEGKIKEVKTNFQTMYFITDRGFLYAIKRGEWQLRGRHLSAFDMPDATLQKTGADGYDIELVNGNLRIPVGYEGNETFAFEKDGRRLQLPPFQPPLLPDASDWAEPY